MTNNQRGTPSRAVVKVASGMWDAFIRSLAVGVFLLLPTIASATTTPCVATTVDQLLGTTCSIGDKAFDFTSYEASSLMNPGSISGPGIPASAITFAPDSSDPLAPAFTLSSPDFTATTSGLGQEDALNEALLFAVFTVNGNATLEGTSETLTSPSTSGSGISDMGSIGAAIFFPASVCLSMAQQHTNFETTTASSQSCALTTPVSMADARLSLGTAAEGTASASFTSATFAFQQTNSATVVPEPASWLLFGSGVLAMIATLRRKEGWLGPNG